jgi:hypothetical protein
MIGTEPLAVRERPALQADILAADRHDTFLARRFDRTLQPDAYVTFKLGLVAY